MDYFYSASLLIVKIVVALFVLRFYVFLFDKLIKFFDKRKEKKESVK